MLSLDSNRHSRFGGHAESHTAAALCLELHSGEAAARSPLVPKELALEAFSLDLDRFGLCMNFLLSIVQ